MISMNEFLETCEYRITEGSEYGWSCYGRYAYSLSTWNGLHDQGGWSGNIVFDTVNQTVYEVEICDYTNERAYRMINPDYVEAHRQEAKSRDSSFNQAWDDVEFTDLEVDDDWFQKALSIVSGKEYDTRVSIPIDIPEDELMVLFKMAHERDITFNQLAAEAITAALEDFKRDPISAKERARFFREKQKDREIKNMIKTDII